MLDALAVLAEVDDVTTTRAAVQALQRRLGLAATGEITPALQQQAQAAAQAVHADAHARAAAAAETAAALYDQIAGDREREIEAVRARHPGRPTSLTEEEVGASRLAEGRSALEAAHHWRRAALSRERAEIDAPRNSGVSNHLVGATDSSPTANARGEGGRGASDSLQEAKARGQDGQATERREGASDSPQHAAEGAASRARLPGSEAVVGSGPHSDEGAATGPAGVEQAQVFAARARARAWRAAEAAGPWFRSAAAGHLAAGDRLQGSRALEGALKAAALVAEATAPTEPWPSSHVPENMSEKPE
ncbi:hypothetical protein OV203_31075 [Nannocystis sp. ILAH1]|uniref:hypothetical protein n=1 Tax=unclassified Nannocystis TaxID=2627009 RepID=UPI0022709E48|nr:MULTISPECIES: hypothetical protein [unclassified Nannocystis]MCY0991626.1 hypothetical protein [Nannocystis sp. ILAH1]MCY1066676.1 hypothetical protein [Nannocystis sp. RBIL2]